MAKLPRLIEILLVEDNEGDIELTRDAFEEAEFGSKLAVAEDGDKALDILFQRNGHEGAVRPDIILLDLNLPGTNGTEVLDIIKTTEELMSIPTIILTSSEADKDILESYRLHANCYIVKPVSGLKFLDVAKNIENFWVDIACLPSKD